MPNPSDARRGLRVLIVEDEGLIAEELADRLTRLGMTVIGIVDTEDEALAATSHAHPDVVLMDIRIKGEHDGVHAAGEITKRFDVPVVYLTAHSDPATFERAMATEPFGYVLKPFHERELTIAIDMAYHRHLLDRRLKESERRYVATLASIGDAVVATDLDRRLTFMNPVAESLTEWRFSEVEGRAVEDVVRIAQEDANGLIAISPIERALAARQAVRFEDGLVLISRSDESVPIDDCAAPIIDERGTMSGAVVAFRDIRERRRAEHALKRAQDDLFQAQKMEAVGRLAAGVAHDFNNLLTVINGCTQLAMDDETLEGTTRALLKDVQNAGLRASAITRQFLAFVRKQVLEPRVLDVNALIGDLTTMLRRLIGAQIRLSTTLAPAPLRILADPSQIGLVIVNLVVNARDAMLDGGVISIATSAKSIGATPEAAVVDAAPGTYAVIEVADTGHGIEQAVKRQMFEPYFTTKDVGKGSGLGLATVYGIVRQSGGFIEVDSESGRGATFRVCVPLADAVEDVREPEAPAEPVARGAETVLLVEDEDGVRGLVATVLRRRGYTVIEAHHGEDALEQVARHAAPIDLLVTDVVMPGITGPTLAARLGEIVPGVRVLFMSGYSRETRAGIPDAAFIAKPFTPAALAKKVREILERT